MSSISKKRAKRSSKKYHSKTLSEIVSEFQRLKKRLKRKCEDMERPRKRKRSPSTSSSTSCLSSYSSDSSTSSTSGTSDASEYVHETYTPPRPLSKSSLSQKDKKDSNISRRGASNKYRSPSPEISPEVPHRVEPIVKKRKSGGSIPPVQTKRKPLSEQNSAPKSHSMEKILSNKTTRTKKAKVEDSRATEKGRETSDVENQPDDKKSKSVLKKTSKPNIEQGEQSIGKKPIEIVRKSGSFGHPIKSHNKSQNNQDSDCATDQITQSFSSRKTKESCKEKSVENEISHVEKRDEKRANDDDNIRTSKNTVSVEKSNKTADESTEKIVLDKFSADKTKPEVAQGPADLQGEKNDYETNVELLHHLFGFPKNAGQVLSKTREAIKLAEEFLELMGMNAEVLGGQTSSATTDPNKNLQNREKSPPIAADEEKDDNSLCDEDENGTETLGGKIISILEAFTTKDIPSRLMNLSKQQSPMKTGEFGPAIAESLVAEWSSIIIDSLDKSVESEILNKHLPPENFPLLRVPTINPQLRSIMNEIACAADQERVSDQILLGSGISAIGKALTMLMSNFVEFQQGKTKKLINLLRDAGKILAKLYHMSFLTRRSEIVPKLGQLIESNNERNLIDGFIFGEQFAKTWRNTELCKSVCRNENEKNSENVIKSGKASLVDVATSPMPKRSQAKIDKPKILSVQILPKLLQTVDHGKLKTTSTQEVSVAKPKSKPIMAHSTPRFSSGEASMIQVRLAHRTGKVSNADTQAKAEAKNSAQNPKKDDSLPKSQGTEYTALQRKTDWAKMIRFQKRMEMKKQRCAKNSNKMCVPQAWTNIIRYCTTEESDPEDTGEEDCNYSEDEDVDTENDEPATDKRDCKETEKNKAPEYTVSDSEESEENIAQGNEENNSKATEEQSSRGDGGNDSKEDEKNHSEDEEDNSKEYESEENNPEENGKREPKHENSQAESSQGEENDSKEVEEMSIEEEIDSKEEETRENDKDFIVLKHKHSADYSKSNNANSSLESTKNKKNASVSSSRGERASNSQEDRDSGEEQKDEEKMHSLEKTECWISCNSSLNETRASQILQKSQKIVSEPSSASHPNVPQSWKTTAPPHELLAKVMQTRLRMGKKLLRVHGHENSQETSNVSGLEKSANNVPEDASDEVQELEKP